MENIIDIDKTIYSPIGRMVVSKMASSVCWSNDHMVNEIKSNPELYKEFSIRFNKYKYEL
ncbi:MAG: hypothetical protein O2784_04330 [Proteobacteria bacterium]|jgi:hypothetical protein|nr:hypothetical protein [Pseudomonadota bacterium]